MTETVTIASLGHEGDGIAEKPERVYVPFTLPGETVTIDRDGERGHLENMVTQSRDRTQPLCRHFGICGGCSLQHWAEAPYLAWKRDLVVAALAQRGIAAPVEPVISVPVGSRRRATFSAASTPTGPLLGFNRRASHDLFTVEECPVLVTAIPSALPTLRRIANLVLGAHGAARIMVTACDNGLDVAVATPRGKARSPTGLVDAVASAAAIVRLTLDGEEQLRRLRPEVTAGDARLYPTPGGFLQASRAAETALANGVLEALGGSGPYVDLFSGIGTFTLRLAKRGAVLAADTEADAIEAVQHAARQAKGMKPITARRRDLMRNPMAANEFKGVAGVVFDPPRAGARAQAEALAISSVPHIAAVSCNPATFARDARTLIDGGYRLTKVQPVDQFRFSPHVELVAAFER